MFFRRFAFLAALLLGGCQEIRTEFSDVLRDKFAIAEATYSPSRLDITFSCGLGFSGDFSCGPGLENVPAKYRVVMNSERCTFTFTDADNYREFQHSVNSSLEVSYRESYRAVYDGARGDKRLISKDFLGCQFVKLGSG